MIKQIPRKKLPDTATHSYDLTNSGEAITYSSSRTLQYIRIEEKTILTLSKDGKEIIGNALMFYDYQNSLPNHLTFNKQDLITYNGREYEIRDIEVCKDTSLPHHYEIILV